MPDSKRLSFRQNRKFKQLLCTKTHNLVMKKAYSILIFVLLSFNGFAQPNISLTSVISGLSQPMQFVNAGDGSNRIFIPQKGGDIKVYDKNFSLLGTLLTVTSIPILGEEGLLSLCFHPQYKTNGLFFVYYTNGSGDLEVARYKIRGGDTINVANPASKKVIITIPHPTNANHNGGTLRFGKDGLLYLSTGDGGSGGDPPNNAQTTPILLGKILRFNVNTSDTAPYYTIPPNNPFGNEVLAYGLRNPFRWNFDRLTGDMWIGDVGQSAFEEINRCHRDSLAVNYGWRCYEGNNIYNSGGCGTITNYKFPVVAYANPSDGRSVVGGTVYRGETYLTMKGYYLGTDFYTGKFYKIKFDSLANSYNISTQIIAPANISDFGETENGELFATNLSNGNVYRVQSNGPIQYTFIGNGNWTNPANWSNNNVPPSNSLTGSIIAIRPIVGGECIVNVPVTIAVGTKILIENNKILRMSSNLSVQ
jgi:glucose/arabinose dehydrogenase